MRALTVEERRRERSIGFALAIDVFAVAMIVGTAVATGSLTMFGEAVRSVSIVALFFYNFEILRAGHRGRLAHYEFGAAKLEHFASALLGIGLFFSGLWVAQTVIDTVFAARTAASPLDLALAAIVAAFNATLCVVNYLIVRASAGGVRSETLRTQIQGRLVSMMSALFLQGTLTASALAQDPALSLGFDALGASFVAGLMLFKAVGLVGGALPVLLDARAPEPERARLRAAVAEAFGSEAAASLRTRRAGEVCVAELEVPASPTASPGELSARRAAVEARLRRDGLEIELSVAPVASSRGVEATDPAGRAPAGAPGAPA